MSGAILILACGWSRHAAVLVKMTVTQQRTVSSVSAGRVGQLTDGRCSWWRVHQNAEQLLRLKGLTGAGRRATSTELTFTVSFSFYFWDKASNQVGWFEEERAWMCTCAAGTTWSVIFLVQLCQLRWLVVGRGRDMRHLCRDRCPYSGHHLFCIHGLWIKVTDCVFILLYSESMVKPKQ